MFLHKKIVKSNASNRKKQLFALACGKKLKHLVLNDVKLKLELAEEYIDGKITQEKFYSAFKFGDFREDYFVYEDKKAKRAVDSALLMISDPKAGVRRFTLTLIYNFRHALQCDEMWMKELWYHLTKEKFYAIS
jgi:hypothetical protein